MYVPSKVPCTCNKMFKFLLREGRRKKKTRIKEKYSSQAELQLML